MANEGTNPGKGLPIPYLTAAWSGMSQDDILTGLKDGSILPPPGAQRGWTPNWTASGNDAASAVQSAVVDRARVHDWFAALDPGMAEATFDSIWLHAGTDDTARASALTSYLAGTLLPSTAGADSIAGPARSTAAALDARIAAGADHAHVVDLSSKTGDEIAQLAHADVGVRYALAHLQPVALTGNRAMFATANADGSLDRFDPDSGEAMISDDWLADRGKFLAWKTAEDGGNQIAVSGNQDWTFIDRSTLDAGAAPATLEIRTGAADAGLNQVVFGNDSDEVIKGVRGSDRLYGAGGDDVLRGGAGGDHLEGGSGDDLVLGGAGNDELTGDRGDDELDGGAGADSLNGGSGADLLTGGRGDDRLEGGAGHDTYAVDAGDGNDTVIDADGDGSIEIEGTAVQGTMHPGDGKWTSADGTLDFSLSGESTLTIKAFAAGADHTAAPDNVIEVKNWKNGDLGITLDGNVAEATANPSLASVLAQAEVPVVDFADSIAQQGESAHVAASAPESTAVSAVAGESGDGEGNAVAGVGNGGTAGEGAVESSEFEAALAALLGNPANVPTVDAAAVHDALQSFAGVLEPPDVSEAAFAHSADVAGAVTDAHLADALASDFAADGSEIGAGNAMASVVPRMDWESLFAQKMDGSLRNVAGSNRA